ncbi:CAP domain-containing protein [Winogradskyella sp. 4-2091]|uniref:CAP domain-containing protein n=1 Tax=Winogradskyella sp. 4-2091 TaxID=3381659 RepID=UPI00389195A9
MKYILCFCLLFLCSFQCVNAQLKASDKEKLSELLTEKINVLRKAKGKHPLKRHPDLAKAAQLHTDYMVSRNSLNHVEYNTDFPNPKERVFHFNKSFTNIGENILYTRPKKLPLNKSELERLAYEMFKSWRNSPGHYANMISDSFYYADFGFGYHTTTKRVFATHVFGKKGYIIDGQLSDNAFAVQSTDATCDDLVGNKSNIIINIGNGLTIINNEVIMGYHSVENLHEIIENKNDGFAIDLIDRNQLMCGQENRLDASDIYEGVMLKPVYRDELFANNTAENPKRIIVSLGEIPEHLRGKTLSANIILIKDGKKCSYNVPCHIPSKRYELRDIKPEIYTPKVALKTKGVNGIYEVSFDFKSGKIIPVTNPMLEIEPEQIHSIDIKSYTSVDGNSKTNNMLHSKRADYIKNYLKGKLNIKPEAFKIDAKENWELCYYQTELLGLENTLGNHKPKIKQYLADNKNEFWKEALSLQRRSKAIIYLNGNWKIDDPLVLHYNLVDAILNENYDLVNKVLAEMYLKEESNLFLNEEFVLDNLFDEPELVQNVSALLLKNVYFYSLDNIVFFVRNWLSKPELLSEAAQKNLLNLYSITSRRLLSDWDTNLDDFSKVMHPEKVEPLFESYKNEDKVNPLFLNYHMASIQYYAQINFSSKIEESFKFITDYFRSQVQNIEDETDLSLFFNRWSMYHLTINNLAERFDNNKLDESSAFVFVKTFVAYQNDSDESLLVRVHKRAIKFNKERWCKWIDKDFQNLRKDGVKNLYCNTCNQ